MEPKTVERLWVAIGFLGQALFTSRMIVQWFVSEREKRSVIPPVFWLLSIAGGGVLLSYAIWKKDPVFILGQATGVFIYARNLWFIYRHRGSGESS